MQRIPVGRVSPSHGKLIHPRLTIYNGGWAEIDEYYRQDSNARRRSRKCVPRVATPSTPVRCPGPHRRSPLSFPRPQWLLNWL